MQKTHWPGDHLTSPLLKHFQELLQLNEKYRGTKRGSSVIAQISSNLANITTLLKHGLQKDHPDLTDNAFSALYLNSFSRTTSQGSISLLGQLHEIIPHQCDHRLKVYFIKELFRSHPSPLIHNPEALVAQALEHFKYFDDSDLKCRFSAYMW
jgi:hypothetical protein